jgi:DNA-binding GntR family transcriptional regulator
MKTATTRGPTMERDVLRLREEFMCLPGLCLSARQVARLLAVDLEGAEEVLLRLEAEGLVTRTTLGYRRPMPLMA